jgi:hypothetical protein
LTPRGKSVSGRKEWKSRWGRFVTEKTGQSRVHVRVERSIPFQPVGLRLLVKFRVGVERTVASTEAMLLDL